MPTAYEPNPPDVLAVVEYVMNEHHPRLRDVGFKIAVIVVRKFDADDVEVPSLRVHGVNANALIRKIPERRRALGEYDAEMEINGLVWDAASSRRRDALIDHELTHVVLLTGKDNAVRRNDHGRPMFKLQPDEIVFTGFLEVIARHGDHAFESQAIKGAYGAYVQACQAAASTVAEMVTRQITLEDADAAPSPAEATAA